MKTNTIIIEKYNGKDNISFSLEEAVKYINQNINLTGFQYNEGIYLKNFVVNDSAGNQVRIKCIRLSKGSLLPGTIQMDYEVDDNDKFIEAFFVSEKSSEGVTYFIND